MARWEMREELGFDCKSPKLLAHVMASPRAKQHCSIYLATGLYKSPMAPDEGGYVEPGGISLSKALASALSRRHDVTVLTLLGLPLAKEELCK